MPKSTDSRLREKQKEMYPKRRSDLEGTPNHFHYLIPFSPAQVVTFTTAERCAPNPISSRRILEQTRRGNSPKNSRTSSPQRADSRRRKYETGGISLASGAPSSSSGIFVLPKAGLVFPQRVSPYHCSDGQGNAMNLSLLLSLFFTGVQKCFAFCRRQVYSAGFVAREIETFKKQRGGPAGAFTPFFRLYELSIKSEPSARGSQEKN